MKARKPRSPRPYRGPRRRVLLEAGDPGLRLTATGVLEAAGFHITTCPGPAAGTPCPLLSGRACGLVGRADLVVHALRGPLGQVVLERLPAPGQGGPGVLVLTGPHASGRAGGRPSLAVATSGPDLLEAIYRLHARRDRLIHIPATLLDGRFVTVRAVRPDDSERLREFDAGLSPLSRQLRYLGSKPPMTEDWAKHLTTLDFDRSFGLVAAAGGGLEERIVADCRLVAADRDRAELAIVVADDHQGAGLGRLLVELTLKIAADRGLSTVVADVRHDNSAMALLLRSEGFERVGWELGVMTFEHTPKASAYQR